MNEKITAFQALSRRLPAIWHAIHSGVLAEHTSVVVPSLSFDQAELEKIQGVSFYEERLLFTLMRLRDPRARVIYVLSQPVHPEIIDYYLQLLVGVTPRHAHRRLRLLCMYDASAKPLTQKILERPRVIRRLRDWIAATPMAYLTCFNSTPLERELALALDVPLNAADPELLYLGTKSGSRDTFEEAGTPYPMGRSHLSSEEEILDALDRLARVRPGIRSAIIKLNESFAGEGNALFRYPETLATEDAQRKAALTRALETLEWTATSESKASFMGKVQAMGAIVEERIEATDFHSPSVQMRIDPDGQLRLVSTHDQVLGGSTGQSFLGCRFPAREEYRDLIQAEALKIGEVLRRRGVVSRFGIDFVVARDPGEAWRAYAIEINLRMGGTTHPFLALQFLTTGELDPVSGEFLTPRGDRKYYFATDHLKSPAYKGLLPEDFMEILTNYGLHFDPATETGVLFHMIGAISQFGKMGLTCIADSPSEADALYRRTVEILDHETGESVGFKPHLSRFFDEPVPAME